MNDKAETVHDGQTDSGRQVYSGQCAYAFDDCGPAVLPLTGHVHEPWEECDPGRPCDETAICERCADEVVRVAHELSVPILDRRGLEPHGAC